MKIGMKVGLGPGNIVLDGGPAPPTKRGHSSPPIFCPSPLWPNGWMDQDATWSGGRPRRRPHCVRWGPSYHARGAQQPTFFPMSIVAKRSPISATAEQLLFFVSLLLFFVWLRASRLSWLFVCFWAHLSYHVIVSHVLYQPISHTSLSLPLGMCQVLEPGSRSSYRLTYRKLELYFLSSSARFSVNIYFEYLFTLN